MYNLVLRSPSPGKHFLIYCEAPAWNSFRAAVGLHRLMQLSLSKQHKSAHFPVQDCDRWNWFRTIFVSFFFFLKQLPCAVSVGPKGNKHRYDESATGGLYSWQDAAIYNHSTQGKCPILLGAPYLWVLSIFLFVGGQWCYRNAPSSSFTTIRATHIQICTNTQ